MNSSIKVNYRSPEVLLIVASSLVFLPTLAELLPIWLTFNQNIAHGLFACLIFIWLLVSKPPLVPAQQQPSSFALLTFFTVFLVWLLVSVANIDTLSYLLLPVGVFAIAMVLGGWKYAWSLKVHVFTLVLALPIWQDLIPALVSLATLVVTFFVQLLNITAYIEGSNIELPYGTLFIADGCSGVRYFAISLLLANTVSVLNGYRLKSWLMALLIGGFIGLLVNWVRIIALVVIGYETQMQSSLVADHEVFGWLVFAGIVLPVLYFSPNVTVPASSAKHFRIEKLSAMAIVASAAVSLLVWSTSYLPNATNTPFQVQNSSDFEPLPNARFKLPNSFIVESFETDSGIAITVGQFQRANRNEKLVPYIAPLYDNDDWTRVETIAINGLNVAVMMHRITKKRELVAVSYQLGSKKAQTYEEIKLWQIPASFLPNQQFAILVANKECKIMTCSAAAEKVANALEGISLE